MKLICKYNKTKKKLFLALFTLVSSIDTTICIIPQIYSFYESTIERSSIMQYALFSYFNAKNWLSPHSPNKVHVNNLTTLQRIFKAPSLLTAVNPFMNGCKSDNYFFESIFKRQKAATLQNEASSFKVENTKIDSYSFSMNIAESIKKVIKERQEYLNAFKRKQIIKPIYEDELYKNARGRLVVPLRSYIKNAKNKLDISDDSLIDAYSRSFGGGDYYITVGKNSNGIFKGVRHENDSDLQTFYNAQLRGTSKHYGNLKAQLEGNLKIHIQPASMEQYLMYIYRLIELGKNNPEFSNAMSFFKVYTDINFNCPKAELADHLQEHSNDGVVPIIVLYPATGKEHAQKVFDIIYRNFGNLRGLNCAPCYNEKVTSSFYITQQNRNQKQQFEQLFNEPRVYFNAVLAGVPSHSYRLKNPRVNNLFEKYQRALANNDSTPRITQLIKKIQRKNFSLSCAHDDGFSLLDYAYKYNRRTIIDMLREQKAVSVYYTPIKCIETDDVEILKLLLESNGYDWHCLDEQGNSLFHYVLKYGSKEILQVLKESDSYRVDSLNRNYNTPLAQCIKDINNGDLVAREKHVETLKAYLLLKPGMSKIQVDLKKNSDPISKEIYDLIERYAAEYKQEEELARELRSWQAIDLNSN